MKILKAAQAAAMALALTVTISSAQADPRLFSDSKLVVKDRISVEVIGHGPDLVFVPGLASSRETWKATAERLKDKYRLHLVQVAGFAGEPARGNAKGEVLAPTAEAIDAYIVENKLSPATLIGHSLGGTMALYLAENHPEHLKKILIVDAFPFYPQAMMGPTVTAEMMKPMADGIRAGTSPMSDAANTQMIAGMVTSSANRAMVTGWSKASDASVVMNALADDMTLDLRPAREKIPTPVTLLYPDYASSGPALATLDTKYNRSYAPIPDKTITRIDNSLHFIMLDQPEKFAAALDLFLKN